MVPGGSVVRISAYRPIHATKGSMGRVPTSGDTYHQPVTAPNHLFRDPIRTATAAGALTVVPLLIWWAGWFPGLMTSDSIDQWNQALTSEFSNHHPITHTAFLWVVSLVWESPGAVALIQVLLMALLLAMIARRLVQVGIPLVVSIVTVWVIALLPMTGATTISILKDIPFGLAMGWVFVELLALAQDRTRFWATWFGPVRLGVALGLLWALRANGKYTVILLVVALAIGYREHLNRLAALAGVVLALGIALPLLLITALSVTNRPIEFAQVFMPDVAAVLVHAPDSISASNMELILAVAPIEVWQTYYDCGDSSPLLFNQKYNNGIIQENPWAYRRLVVGAALGAPATVLGHRWCAGEYLLSPFNRTHTFVHRPEYNIWPNTLGLARAPISDRAFAVTSWLYIQAERSSIEWLTWRPAIFMLAALGTYGAVWSRRPLTPLRWIPLFFVIHLANVFVTSPSHEFRYAFGLYLMALASLPLWYLITDPERATITRPEVPSEVS